MLRRVLLSGAPAIWTPEYLANPLNLWIDDSSTLTDSSGVAQWNDRSGYGNHLTQSTSGNRPTVNAASLNGLRTVSFNGSSQFLSMSGSALNIMRNIGSGWVMAVYKLTTDTSGTERPIIDWSVNAGTVSTRTGLFAALSSAKNKPQFGGRRLDTDSSAWAVNGSELSAQWVMALGIIDYTNRQSSLYINGNAATTATGLWTAGGNSADTASLNARVGGNNASSPTTFFRGEIAAMFATGGSKPSSEEIDRMFGWLAWRYGLQGNLPSGHPYKLAAPMLADAPAVLATMPTVSASDSAMRVSFRASKSGSAVVKYSTASDLSGASLTSASSVGSSTDFTVKVDASGLANDTTYYYTVLLNGVDQLTAPYPSAKTFPANGSPAAFSFAFGSCTSHSSSTDAVFDAVPSGASFLMHLGDTIYADVDSPVANTLPSYRLQRRNALAGLGTTSSGFKTLRSSKPIFTMWDDHDLEDDFSAGTTSPLYAPAKQSFQEYHARSNPDSVADGELYYTFQVGDVGFFVADLRSYRSANTHTDNSSKTILGDAQKAALKAWLLVNNAALKFKFICCSVAAHGYAAYTAGDSWGGVDDGTQAPNGANGFRTERNEIWDYIDANAISGVVFISGDQHWSGSFKTTYASRPRYEFMASPFNQTMLTPVSRATDPVNGPVFWKYGSAVNFGVISVDTTATPPTVSFQLYGASGSFGSSYLTTINLSQIDAGL